MYGLENLIMTTNPDFWDCHCKENYIHSKSETNCLKCGATWINNTDVPDSMTDEIYPPQEERVCMEPCDFYKDLYDMNKTEVQKMSFLANITKDAVEERIGSITDEQYLNLIGVLDEHLDQHIEWFYSVGLIASIANGKIEVI